jgi:hypothetical protein
MMHVRFVLARGMFGMIEASPTRSRSGHTPCHTDQLRRVYVVGVAVDVGMAVAAGVSVGGSRRGRRCSGHHWQRMTVTVSSALPPLPSEPVMVMESG